MNTRCLQRPCSHQQTHAAVVPLYNQASYRPCASLWRASAVHASPRSRRHVHVGSYRRHGSNVVSVDFPGAPFNSNSWDWFDQWYPVGFVKDFDPTTPHRFTLLNTPLVIWYQPPATHSAADSDNQTASSASASGSSSSEGCWRVFSDVCPHRLVPLSEGRITPAGLLECPYHGWAFNGQGGCETIPQAGHYATPRACATAYPCLVRQGLLFVKPKPLPKRPVPHDDLRGHSHGSSSTTSSSSSSSRPASGVNRTATAAAAAADVPTVPELDSPDWLVQDTWRDVPYDWSSLMENVLDASHVPFTHHKSISNRHTLGDYDMTLTHQVSRGGFQGVWPTGPRAGALGQQTSWFRPPCYMQHKIDAAEKGGYETMVVVYAVPIGPGKCRLINRNAFRFVRGGLASALPALLMRAVPGWAIHLGTQVPLEDDQIFLHLGEAEYVAAAAAGKTAAQAYYMPSPADTYVIAFRKWIEHHGNGGPFGHVGRPEYRRSLEPRLNTTQLLDRYSQHTANCAQCQAALKQVQTAQGLLAWATNITAGLAAVTAAVAAVAAATAAAGGSSAAAAAGSSGPGSSALLSLLLSGVAAAANLLVPLGGAAGSAAVLPPDAAAGLAAAAGLRVVAWGMAAGMCWLLQGQLGALEGAFFHGSYPPPRNTDRS